MANVNKDKVIATVSHELRTPLNGILGILEIVEKKVSDTAVSEYIFLCKDNANLLLNLVNSILDLQQISAGKLKLNPAQIEVRKTCQSIIQLFEFQCKEKNIKIESDIHQDVPYAIITDENRLKQILINLVSNAVKFTSKGGVKLEVCQHKTSPKSLCISVIDTGIGIKEQDQKQLFKMYGRIEDGESVNKNGVGLGLTISNALAAILNGEPDGKGIEVESRYQLGSKFYFEIQKNIGETQSPQRNQIKEQRIPTEISNDPETEISKGILLQNKNVKREKKLEEDDDSDDIDQRDCDEFLKPFDPQFKMESYLSLKKINISISPLGPSNNRADLDLEPYTILGRSLKKQDYLQSTHGVNTARFGLEVFMLIVDDNPFNLLVAKNLIQDFGYKSKTALGGQEAIEMVLSCVDEGIFLKAIFMDCQMPLMDGYEATKILRDMMSKNEIPRIPIFGWTANNAEEDIRRCYEAGMEGHLPKPASKLDLLKVISKL